MIVSNGGFKGWGRGEMRGATMIRVCSDDTVLSRGGVSVVSAGDCGCSEAVTTNVGSKGAEPSPICRSMVSADVCGGCISCARTGEVVDGCAPPGSTGDDEVSSISASEEIEISSRVVWSAPDIIMDVPQMLQKRYLPCKSVLQFVQRI